MNTREKLKVHKVLSALTIAIGFVLMLGKIYADSEPGAIPILLVVLGMGWCRRQGRRFDPQLRPTESGIAAPIHRTS